VQTFREQGKGVLRVSTFAIFDAKNLGFFEIYGVSARTKGD